QATPARSRRPSCPPAHLAGWAGTPRPGRGPVLAERASKRAPPRGTVAKVNGIAPNAVLELSAAFLREVYDPERALFPFSSSPAGHGYANDYGSAAPPRHAPLS